ARERVRTAERLRAKVHVHAEGSALAHQAVEQLCGLLRHLVFLDEELLKLVDDEQEPRQWRRAGHVAITVHVLNAGIPKTIGPFAHRAVEPLEHADAELPFALN